MFDTPISKCVGSNYEIVCDRKNCTVTIYYKEKKQKSFQFSRMGRAIDFYARLKQVKDVKIAEALAPQYK
jgi:hypothetical protein